MKKDTKILLLIAGALAALGFVLLTNSDRSDTPAQSAQPAQETSIQEPRAEEAEDDVPANTETAVTDTGSLDPALADIEAALAEDAYDDTDIDQLFGDAPTGSLTDPYEL